ncbi:MAG TPA: amidase family protein [Rhizomicrobium sp.]|jgi:amidase|nr:amidase family protein [Rhizomicrobium sp.]
MAIPEYPKFDGIGLADLVARREVTAAELVDEAIARAEQANPRLNAVVFSDYGRAREIARGNLPAGPFTGVPFFLKDIFGFAKGMPTRQGSRFIPPIRLDHDSLFTSRLRAAGLIMLGKTNVPEFGLVPTTEGKLYGPCRNPWNLEHSPGGSSGGSAALVAAGVVPLAHANDGGGSIRIPASCCGLVGLKPTRGRSSYAPDLGDAIDGLGVDLVVSRTVRDTAAALDAVAGNVQGDPYWAPPPDRYFDGLKSKLKKLRIAFSISKLGSAPLHPDCVKAVRRAAALCSDLGHNLEEASPQLDPESLIQPFMALWGANLAAGLDYFGRLIGREPAETDFEGLTWGLYRAGKQVSASEYLTAKAVMAHAAREAARFHQTYDVWFSATLGSPPVRLGTFDMEERDPMRAFTPLIEYVPFTAMQNATGQPAINLPLHWNDQGLPIGVQFIGRFGDELTLLQLAAQIEEAAPWYPRYGAIANQGAKNWLGFPSEIS